MTSGRLVPFSPIVFKALFIPICEYCPDAAIFPVSIFVASLCKVDPCALPTTVVAPVAIFNPAEAAPVAPPINVPDINPEHAPSNAPCHPPEIPPPIAPITAPEAPPATAPESAAPHITVAAPPVQTVATANPAIATAPIATFAQLGKDQLPSASKRLTGLFIQ